jgi:hypothetical protein
LGEWRVGSSGAGCETEKPVEVLLVALVFALLEGVEGFSEAGGEGEDEGDVEEAGGAGAVAEGVEVALWGAGAGSFSASGHGFRVSGFVGRS